MSEPMDLDQAELLARVGRAGRVATALLIALDEARARVAELEAIERRVIQRADDDGTWWPEIVRREARRILGRRPTLDELRQRCGFGKETTG